MAFSLGELLTVAARRWPDHVAVRADGEDVTYRRLRRRADAIGRLLLAHGLRRGDRVAVLMNRSPDSLAGIYGIMAAGGAYVPLDAGAPADRLGAVLRDCDVSHVLVGAQHVARLGAALAGGGSVVRLVLGADQGSGLAVEHALAWPVVDQHDFDEPLCTGVIERDLALIFYTSGSTGKPKGVAHSHRSMLSNVEWAVAEFGVDASDRFANVTSHHFDLSWFEMFVPAAVGGALVMVPEDVVHFPPRLAELLAAERVSVWCSVPSVLVGLVQRGGLGERDLRSLHTVLFAGERFPVKHLRKLMDLVAHPRYVNMYGTTETHIAAFHPVGRLTDDAWLPIGSACGHVNLRIVAPDGSEVAPGESGELVIRGPSLMDGYWKLPERTATALRAENFDGVTDIAYHTGDLVRRRADDAIEIIGRSDRRVKIRGYLVDLDEVEAVLLRHKDVAEGACYLVGEDTPGAHVGAAVRLRRGAGATGSELRVHVAEVLPTYAVPEFVEVLDDLPRTGSGKLSRNDLAALVTRIRAERRDRASARDGHESVVAALRGYVAEELGHGVSGLGPDDDLFALGVLNSLGVTQLVVFIEEQWGVSVPNEHFVRDNFSTLRSVANLVDQL